MPWVWLYLVGVAWGLVRTDARLLPRVAMALLWPIGPLAFVVTVLMLLLVAPVAFLGRR